MTDQRTILVTGATGYIGGRLIPRLIEEGLQVRVLVRSRERVLARAWFEQVKVVVGDALDPQTLNEALAGVETAYYLIHSMSRGDRFHEVDMRAARSFGQVAREAGVGRIIYLGGLGDPEANLSRHLRSRQESGRALREGGVPVTEFRAAVIVGSGSISFEMIRYLVERLPVMVCPRWIYSGIQPIAVDDLLEFLVAALNTPESVGRTIESWRKRHDHLPRTDVRLCQGKGSQAADDSGPGPDSASLLLLGPLDDPHSRRNRRCARRRPSQQRRRDQ